MKQHKGFSLLELLVVIFIIGILIAMIVPAFSTAQKKSRDARRKGDMKAIQAGFEQYYASNGNGANYGANCATMYAVNAIFPAGTPTDPKGSSPYIYYCSASTAGYCACARMEGAAGSGNSDNSSCAFDSSGNEQYFCVTNLQ